LLQNDRLRIAGQIPCQNQDIEHARPKQLILRGRFGQKAKHGISIWSEGLALKKRGSVGLKRQKCRSTFKINTNKAL
jgi:hypothetical protein